MTPEFLVMIGAFPPPVGGAAKNNLLLYETVAQSGLLVTKLDTAAKEHGLHKRNLAFHRERVRRNLQAMLRARKLAHDDGVLYLVPDGGAGLLYSLAQVRAAARGFGRLVIHHRTYLYIDYPKRAMAAIVSTVPDRTIHVFLTQGMALDFQNRYGPVNYLVASNARFVESEALASPPARQPGRLRIGHLSNLCREKGFFDVAAAFDALRASNCDVELRLAGPVVDREVDSRLSQLRRDHGDLIFHNGPVHGTQKADYYRALDLFLFPTRFRQEAAPNVVYEALAAGVPTLATNLGCLREMLPEQFGAVCDTPDRFPKLVVEYTQALTIDHDRLRAMQIKSELGAICAESRLQYAALLTLLGAKPESVVAQDF